MGGGQERDGVARSQPFIAKSPVNEEQMRVPLTEGATGKSARTVSAANVAHIDEKSNAGAAVAKGSPETATVLKSLPETKDVLCVAGFQMCHLSNLLQAAVVAKSSLETKNVLVVVVALQTCSLLKLVVSYETCCLLSNFLCRLLQTPVGIKVDSVTYGGGELVIKCTRSTSLLDDHHLYRVCLLSKSMRCYISAVCPTVFVRFVVLRVGLLHIVLFFVCLVALVAICVSAGVQRLTRCPKISTP